MARTWTILAAGGGLLLALTAIGGPAAYTGQWGPTLSPACQAAFTSVSADAQTYEASVCDPRERKDIATFEAWHASPEGVAFDKAEQQKDMAQLISPSAPAASQ